MRDFEDLIERCSGKHKYTIARLCEPLFKTFGLSHFFHQRITWDGLFYVVGSNPGFMLDYVDQKLFKYNPFITQAKQLKSGIYFFDSVKDKKFQSTMDLSKEKHGFNHFILIVESDLLGCNQYGFGMPAFQVDMQPLIVNEINLLEQFTIFFKNELQKPYAEIQNNPIDVASKLKPSSFSETQSVPKIQLDDEKRVSFLAKIKTVKALSAYPKLSRREIECLKYYLQGMTVPRIAEKLFLSPRTVESYIKNIKIKLCCNTRSELIYRLNQMQKLGLVHIPSINLS